MIKVAGVTCENRQTTLARLESMNRNIITVDLVYTTFNGEFAIKLVENSTGLEIGWIPRSELYRFISCNIRQMTGFIGYYNGIYYARGDWQQAPTYQAYVQMYNYCTRNGYAMPAFDARAYAGILATNNLYV